MGGWSQCGGLHPAPCAGSGVCLQVGTVMCMQEASLWVWPRIPPHLLPRLPSPSALLRAWAQPIASQRGGVAGRPHGSPSYGQTSSWPGGSGEASFRAWRVSSWVLRTAGASAGQVLRVGLSDLGVGGSVGTAADVFIRGPGPSPGYSRVDGIGHISEHQPTGPLHWALRGERGLHRDSQGIRDLD